MNVKELWGAHDAGARVCTECSAHVDNVFVDDDDGVVLCRRCYERVSFRDRLHFTPAFSRTPRVEDFSRRRRTAPRSMYGRVVYCLIWALLRRRLPTTLVRVIVDAPIRRHATDDGAHYATFFGERRGPSMTVQEDGTRLYRGDNVVIVWERDCRLNSLIEYNDAGALDGLRILAIRDNIPYIVDEYMNGRRVIERRLHASDAATLTYRAWFLR